MLFTKNNIIGMEDMQHKRMFKNCSTFLWQRWAGSTELKVKR